MAVLALFPICIVLAGFALIVHHSAVYLWDAKRLRKYPTLNPLCGVTNLGYILQLWRSDKFRTRSITQAHRENSVIRIGPSALSFSDVGAIQDIYGHSTTCLKGDMYSTPAGPHRNILDSVDKQEHSQKRKRLSAAFATKHLEEWEHKIVDKCNRLIARFDQHCTSSMNAKRGVKEDTIDLRKWFNLFTVEAIADIALSEHLGLLEAGTDTVVVSDQTGNRRCIQFIQSVHGVGRMAAPIVWSRNGYATFKQVATLLSTSYANEVRNNSNYDDIVRYMTLRRLQRHNSGEKIDDLFTCLVQDKQGTATGLLVGEIAAEVSVFSSDTTAIALTHVLYYLLKNPDRLRRLREEIDNCIESDTVIPAYADVKTLPYLKACLDESLRLSPPVSFGLERKTPPEGASINGEWVAGDVMVSVPAYVAHRDSSIFPDPEEYIPERWLTEESKTVQKYFIPFSTGARGCIGRNISYIEQHVLLAALVKRYEFALPYMEWELRWEERFNLWPSAMPLRVWRRTRQT
ncbi:hypothetical protein LTR64_000075 [Lithohypha guttulata]|uniref:uncharacterized protein n=1 Tax=Lithohypha guttulata TaxID=1690604 RepID=UPI002DDEC72B|nr:hypothetical protein LTR51_007437 [Lithohypha guttulata]